MALADLDVSDFHGARAHRAPPIAATVSTASAATSAPSEINQHDPAIRVGGQVMRTGRLDLRWSPDRWYQAPHLVPFPVRGRLATAAGERSASREERTSASRPAFRVNQASR